MFMNGYGFMLMSTILVVFFVIMLAIGVLAYVFYSLGLYTIAKRRNIKYPGLAWVPVASLWVLGSIADQYDYLATGSVKKLRLVLAWLAGGVCGCGLILMIISVIIAASFDPSLLIITGLFGFIVWAAIITLAIFILIALYKLYRSCTPDNATVLLVLSIFFSIIIPFTVFALRNSDKGMPVPQPQIEQPVQ